jgi:hypothetical protein
MKTKFESSLFHMLLTIILLSLIFMAGALHAQSQVREIVIPEDGVDISAFPSISVRAIVSDDTRSRVAGLDEGDFTLQEDGREIPFTLSESEVGVQVVFVLDASLSVRQAGSSGYTRLEEGKQVIYDFATNTMAEGLDQVAVLAPASSTTIQKVAPLPDDPADFTSFRNTVRDGTYLYELPADIQATPLNDMVSRALDILAGAESGMHRAVVVISDGVDVISDRQVADIVNRANQFNIPIYTVIFGPANNWGGAAESNMKRLSLDTFGDHFQLAATGRNPEPIEDVIAEAMNPLHTKLAGQRTQYVLTYSSGIFSPGSHEVAISVGNKSARRSISVNIQPPEVAVAEPSAGATITRSTDDPNLPLEEIEPRTQTVAFQVTFPDGFERDLSTVELLVDGVAVLDTCTPPCSEITWNIAGLGAGSHSVRIRVQDQQGLSAESREVPISLAIIVPTPIPTPVPTAAAPQVVVTPVAVSCEETYSGIQRILRCSPEFFAIGALAVAIVALVLVVVVMRRPRQAVANVAKKVKDATIAFFPSQMPPSPALEAKATLEVIEGDDAYTLPIELRAASTRLGRDEDLVQVAFQNRSVSRLHARIAVEQDRQGDERFVLYDEGSTSGSYVNFQPVGINGQPLQDGDIIHLGSLQLRFNVKAPKPEVVHDDTIPMMPATPVEEEPVGDEFATAPYVPQEPVPDMDDTQPFAGSGQYPPPTPPSDEDDDEEGLSTEPYVPMDFGDE